MLIAVDYWIYLSISMPNSCFVPNSDIIKMQLFSMPNNTNVICYVPLKKENQYCYYNLNSSALSKLGLWLDVKCSGIIAPFNFSSGEKGLTFPNMVGNTTRFNSGLNA